MENSRDGLVHMIRHPIDTVEGLGTLAFDGVNAVTDVAFGVSTQGSRARNAMRSVLINDTISTFNNGDNLTRFEMISEVGSGMILGGAIGGPATQVVGKMATMTSRAEVALSGSRYALFGKSASKVRVNGVDFNYNKTLKEVFKIPEKNQLHSNAVGINSAEALNSKLSAIQKAQSTATKIEHMLDGRIRYYLKETPSRTLGATRGASYVTEYNPSTGNVRSSDRMSHDHVGNVVRIHPKMMNGQYLNSPHFPPTARELIESQHTVGYSRRFF